MSQATVLGTPVQELIKANISQSHDSSSEHLDR